MKIYGTRNRPRPNLLSVVDLRGEDLFPHVSASPKIWWGMVCEEIDGEVVMSLFDRSPNPQFPIVLAENIAIYLIPEMEISFIRFSLYLLIVYLQFTCARAVRKRLYYIVRILLHLLSFSS
jgi:hypothetical protein